MIYMVIIPGLQLFSLDGYLIYRETFKLLPIRYDRKYYFRFGSHTLVLSAMN